MLGLCTRCCSTSHPYLWNHSCVFWAMCGVACHGAWSHHFTPFLICFNDLVLVCCSRQTEIGAHFSHPCMSIYPVSLAFWFSNYVYKSRHSMLPYFWNNLHLSQDWKNHLKMCSSRYLIRSTRCHWTKKDGWHLFLFVGKSWYKFGIRKWKVQPHCSTA